MPARDAAAARGGRLVLALQLVAVGLVVGWFATGHASAPDGGLLQLDVLSLSDPVPGVAAVGGRPTMVVLTGRLVGACRAQVERPRELSGSYGRVLVTPDLDPGGALARRLGLAAAVASCSPGYVLVDPAGRVRYRSYDPGWAGHAQEQEILLAALDRPR